MTSERVEEIRSLRAAVEVNADDDMMYVETGHLRFLLAERDRLAAEVEGLRRAVSDMRDALTHASKALKWDAVMESALIHDTLKLHARLDANKGGG